MARTKEPPKKDEDPSSSIVLPSGRTVKEEALEAFNNWKAVYTLDDFKRWREEHRFHLCRPCMSNGLKACDFTDSAWYCAFCRQHKAACNIVHAFRKSRITENFQISSSLFDEWVKEWRVRGVANLRGGKSNVRSRKGMRGRMMKGEGGGGEGGEEENGGGMAVGTSASVNGKAKAKVGRKKKRKKKKRGGYDDSESDPSSPSDSEEEEDEGVVVEVPTASSSRSPSKRRPATTTASTSASAIRIPVPQRGRPSGRPPGRPRRRPSTSSSSDSDSSSGSSAGGTGVGLDGSYWNDPPAAVGETLSRRTLMRMATFSPGDMELPSSRRGSRRKDGEGEGGGSSNGRSRSRSARGKSEGGDIVMGDVEPGSLGGMSTTMTTPVHPSDPTTDPSSQPGPSSSSGSTSLNGTHHPPLFSPPSINPPAHDSNDNANTTDTNNPLTKRPRSPHKRLTLLPPRPPPSGLVTVTKNSTTSTSDSVTLNPRARAESATISPHTHTLPPTSNPTTTSLLTALHNGASNTLKGSEEAVKPPTPPQQTDQPPLTSPFTTTSKTSNLTLPSKPAPAPSPQTQSYSVSPHPLYPPTSKYPPPPSWILVSSSSSSSASAHPTSSSRPSPLCSSQALLASLKPPPLFPSSAKGDVSLGPSGSSKTNQKEGEDVDSGNSGGGGERSSGVPVDAATSPNGPHPGPGVIIATATPATVTSTSTSKTNTSTSGEEPSDSMPSSKQQQLDWQKPNPRGIPMFPALSSTSPITVTVNNATSTTQTQTHSPIQQISIPPSSIQPQTQPPSQALSKRVLPPRPSARPSPKKQQQQQPQQEKKKQKKKSKDKEHQDRLTLNPTSSSSTATLHGQSHSDVDSHSAHSVYGSVMEMTPARTLANNVAGEMASGYANGMYAGRGNPLGAAGSGYPSTPYGQHVMGIQGPGYSYGYAYPYMPYGGYAHPPPPPPVYSPSREFAYNTSSPDNPPPTAPDTAPTNDSPSSNAQIKLPTEPPSRNTPTDTTPQPRDSTVNPTDLIKKSALARTGEGQGRTLNQGREGEGEDEVVQPSSPMSISSSRSPTPEMSSRQPSSSSVTSHASGDVVNGASGAKDVTTDTTTTTDTNTDTDAIEVSTTIREKVSRDDEGDGISIPGLSDSLLDDDVFGLGSSDAHLELSKALFPEHSLDEDRGLGMEDSLANDVDLSVFDSVGEGNHGLGAGEDVSRGHGVDDEQDKSTDHMEGVEVDQIGEGDDGGGGSGDATHEDTAIDEIMHPDSDHIQAPVEAVEFDAIERRTSSRNLSPVLDETQQKDTSSTANTFGIPESSSSITAPTSSVIPPTSTTPTPSGSSTPQAQFQSLLVERQTWFSQRQDLLLERQELLSVNTTLQDDNERLRGVVGSLKRECAKLRERVGLVNEENSRSKREVGELKEAHGNLDVEKERLQEEAKDLKKEKERLSDEVEALKEVDAGRSRALLALQKNERKCREVNARLEEEVSSLKRQVERAQKENEEMKTKESEALTKLEQEIALEMIMEKQIDELREEMEALQEEQRNNSLLTHTAEQVPKDVVDATASIEPPSRPPTPERFEQAVQVSIESNTHSRDAELIRERELLKEGFDELKRRGNELSKHVEAFKRVVEQADRPSSSSTVVPPGSANPDALGGVLLSQMGSWSTMASLVQQCITIASSPSQASSSRSAKTDRVNDGLRQHLESMYRLCWERESFIFNAAGSLAPIYQGSLESEILSTRSTRELGAPPSSARLSSSVIDRRRQDREAKLLELEEEIERRKVESKIRALERQLRDDEEEIAKQLEMEEEMRLELRRLKGKSRAENEHGDSSRRYSGRLSFTTSSYLNDLHARKRTRTETYDSDEVVDPALPPRKRRTVAIIGLNGDAG